MIREIRKHGSRAIALAATLLFAGVGKVEAGSIDIRVTPEMRVVQSSPAPKTRTVKARWSREASVSTLRSAPPTRMRVVHYPTVVLGTANYIGPSNNTVAVNGTGFPVPVYYGDLLQMQFGGAAAIADSVDGTTNAAATFNRTFTDAAIVGGRNEPITDFSGRVRSRFPGIAGPGFGFGVAGPAFIPSSSGARLNGNVGVFNQGITLNGSPGANVTSGSAPAGGSATANIVIGTAGASVGGSAVGGMRSIGR
jgi:hypothetical protein